MFRYLFKKIFFIFLVFIILVIIGIFINLLDRTNKNLTINFSPTPTPIPLTFTPKTYVNNSQRLTLLYPQEWIQETNISSQDQTAIFSFVQNDKKYLFIASPPGQGETDTSLMNVDKLEATSVIYGGRYFLKKVWSYKSEPVLISAIPNEKGFIFDSFTMDVPTGNSEKYLGIFDQIMREIKMPFTPDGKPGPTIMQPTIILIPTNASQQ